MLCRFVLVFGLLSSTAFAAQLFGRNGSDGANARVGYDGRNGASVVLDVDGSSRAYRLHGEDGEDATGNVQDGSSANSCQQPFEPGYDLVGAAGGNGGNGARGGNGGNGGSVHLYLQNEAMLRFLNVISVVNPGGSPGTNAPRAGRGAPGCQCTLEYWQKSICTWTYYRTIDGQKSSGWFNDQNTDCTSDSNPPRIQPYSDGDWELSKRYNETFRCTHGRNGSNGTSGERAQSGSYGDVVVFVGGSSKTSTRPALTDLSIGTSIGKNFLLNGYDSQKREGLRALLANDSDVKNTYWFRRYFERQVRIEWLPKVSPQDAGVADKFMSISLAGTASAPLISVSLPAKLTHKVTAQGNTSVVAITNVLNDTNPNKIAECARYHGKGAYMCQFSDQCTYSDGLCLPK